MKRKYLLIGELCSVHNLVGRRKWDQFHFTDHVEGHNFFFNHCPLAVTP